MTKYRLYKDENGALCVERLVFPRFKGIVDFENELSNVKIVERIDEISGSSMDVAMGWAAAMRETGEFLVNHGNKEKN